MNNTLQGDLFILYTDTRYSREDAFYGFKTHEPAQEILLETLQYFLNFCEKDLKFGYASTNEITEARNNAGGGNTSEIAKTVMAGKSGGLWQAKEAIEALQSQAV